MAIARATVRAVKRIAEAIVLGTDDAESFSRGRRWGQFPESLREAAGDYQQLVLSGREFDLYEKALALLAREDELEHLEKRDIDKELWEFVCRLFLEKRCPPGWQGEKQGR